MKKIINQSQGKLFEIEEKIEKSTATIAELRIPIFLPFRQLAHNSKLALSFKKNGGKMTFETSWGKVSIRGRKLLTDVHRDILDCISSYNIKTSHVAGTGEIDIYFTLTGILKHYGQKNPNANVSWLKERIEEIRDTTIVYEDTKGNSFDFNISSGLIYLESERLYKMTLDKKYVKFYAEQLTINYKKELSNLLDIKSPLVKQIVRWFFTHRKEVKYSLAIVFETIGLRGDLMSIRMLQTHKKIVKDNNHILNRFGVDYDHVDEVFYYAGNKNVSFIPSLFSNTALINSNGNLNLLKGVNIAHEENVLMIKEIELITSLDDDCLIEKANIYFVDVENCISLNNKEKLDESEFNSKIQEWINTNKV